MMRVVAAEPVSPPGGRAPARPLFAIGDIHGHLGALEALLAHLSEEIARRYAGAAVDLAILGDLVDRGPDPVGCLRRAAAGLAPEATGGAEVTTRLLLGNHDWYLAAAAGLRDLSMDEADFQGWSRWGGRETLVALALDDRAARDPAAVRAALGDDVCAILEGMALSYETGDVLCVHAGVAPETPLAEQDPHDLIWIREPFLSAAADPRHSWPLGKTVVHGHTPDAWGGFAHRVGVDAGGFASGVFLALELSDAEMRFHAAMTPAAAERAAG